MGTEALWVPLVLSALGTGASVYNQHQTAKKQDSVLADQIRNQSKTQQQANARTSQLINNQATQDDTQQKAQAQTKFQQQLAGNQAQATSALKNPGAVSTAYQNAGANAAQGITNYGAGQGDLLSSMMAPIQQRRDNQKNLDDYSIDLGNLKHKLGSDDYLSQLKLQSIRPNPWLGAASSLLGGAAGAMGGGGSYGSIMSQLAKGQGGAQGPTLGLSSSPDYLDGLFGPSGSYNNPYSSLLGGT